MKKKSIIAQGAEATITLISKPKSNLPSTRRSQSINKSKSIRAEGEQFILKHRLPKSYRLPQLDETITKRRTRAEAKIMKKISKIIPVPEIIQSDEKDKTIIMQHIKGKKLSQHLDKFSLKEQKQILNQIGKSVAKLHKENIAHGDLTTSNMIYTKPLIYFIDFGLSFQSAKYEDKAVDIHLLKQALEAKHFKNWETLYKEFIKSYKSISKESKKVLDQLIKVEKRGRYRH